MSWVRIPSLTPAKIPGQEARLRWQPGLADVSAGLEVLAEDAAVIESETSPNAVADAVEQRLFACLWDIDETTWETIVQPEVNALRDLPDPDRTRQRRAAHPLYVLQAGPDHA
jgi:hypothetical protein